MKLKKVHISKPNTKALKDILKGVISASIVARLSAIAKTLQWYDNAVSWVTTNKKKGLKLTEEELRTLNAANKCREKGLESKNQQEKETNLKAAVQRYEKVCKDLKTPSILKYYDTYLETKTKLEAEEIRLQDKYQNVIMTLKEALALEDLQIRISPKIDAKRKSNGNNVLLYSRPQAEEMKTRLRKEGVLALVVHELPYISRVLSWQPDGIGGFHHDLKKESESHIVLLHKFVKWAQSDSAPSKLVKHHKAQDASTKPAKEKKPPKPGSKVKVPKGSLEFYREGSAIGHLAQRLSSQKEFEIKALFKGIAGVDPIPSLLRIQRHGERYGNWSVEINGSKVKMKILKKEAHS